MLKAQLWRRTKDNNCIEYLAISVFKTRKERITIIGENIRSMQQTNYHQREEKKVKQKDKYLRYAQVLDWCNSIAVRFCSD